MEKKLKPTHKKFADEYIDTGNATLAAKNNLNVTTDNSAAVAGNRLLRNSKVQEYIEDKAETAASIVYQIAQFGESDGVKLSASKDILDRAGFKPIDRSISVIQNINEQSTERTQELANRFNGLLGR